MTLGTVSFVPRRGYGFVKSDAGAIEDYAADLKHLGLQVGDKVQYLQIGRTRLTRACARAEIIEEFSAGSATWNFSNGDSCPDSDRGTGLAASPVTSKGGHAPW